MKQGLNVITLPKTIDNDVAMTDVCFGYDTALGIATEAIDRLHSTAHSHHRILVLELMGNKAGWLALGAGIAGGADVIDSGVFGVMVAARGDGVEPVALKDVVGKRRTVPLDHGWIESARSVHACFGD